MNTVKNDGVFQEGSLSVSHIRFGLFVCLFCVS